jgi:hypothetical protein
MHRPRRVPGRAEKEGFVRKACLPFFAALTMLLLSGVLFSMQVPAEQETAPKEEKKIAAKTCLGCHGPYEKLREATADYKTDNGETVTPHQYVPHAEKTEIPECVECHEPHPIPLEDKSKVAKPQNLDWCYSSCHHAHNLQPCKTCH